MIKVGDLVIVARPSPCCGSVNKLGAIFTVKALRPETGFCGDCSGRQPGPEAFVGVDEGGRSGWISTYRLKRIDPLPESEDTKEREELSA